MRKLRIVFIVVVGLFFYSMLLAGGIRHIYTSKDEGRYRLKFLAGPMKFLAESSTLMYKMLQADEFLQRDTEHPDGFNHIVRQNSFTYPKILVSYKEERFGQKFDLMDINTGKVIKSWFPDNKDLYQRGYNENNPGKPSKQSDLYFMHALMLQDSSLVMNSLLTSLLARIDKNNEIEWLLNDKVYHHAIEHDQAGNLYVCSQPFVSGRYDYLPGAYESYKNSLEDDNITIIREADGKELFSKSVIQILLDNGYEGLLLSKGQIISDQIHLNDVQPALYDGEFWKKGDLLVSCRNLSTVFLYRPSTNKILWLKEGPWYNQHDADFVGSDKIMVFGNNVIRDETKNDVSVANSYLSFSKKRPFNDIYVYNFETDSTATPFHELMKEEGFRTITSGRSELLDNGDIFIEETNLGRIIIGDSLKKKIEFVKRIDEDHISSLFWSRIVR